MRCGAKAKDTPTSIKGSLHQPDTSKHVHRSWDVYCQQPFATPEFNGFYLTLAASIRSEDFEIIRIWGCVAHHEPQWSSQL